MGGSPEPREARSEDNGVVKLWRARYFAAGISM